MKKGKEDTYYLKEKKGQTLNLETVNSVRVISL